MESENPALNPAANQLPEAESLPDGFVDCSTTDPLVPKTPEAVQEKLPHEVTDYKEVTLVEPELGQVLISDDIQLNTSAEDEDSKYKSQEAPHLLTLGGEDRVRVECLNLEKSEGHSHQNISKEKPLAESLENKKIEASETKRKNVKRSFKTEKEFLEFTLKYQQVLSERDSAIAVRDKLESLCRELQRQNKVFMDECKRVSTEGQNLRLDLSNKFQDAIKEVSNKLDEQKDDCLLQLKENEMLKSKLKQLANQYALSEQQFTQKLKQKSLELQLADLKLKQHEEKLLHEQAQMKIYAEQVSQLLTTEKNLRIQLSADGEKFQQFQEALLKSNEVFETFKQDIEKMAKSIKELKKENTFLKSKCDKSDVTLIELAEEREHLKKQLEKTRNQKQKLEALCRSLQAERKANSVVTSSSESVEA